MSKDECEGKCAAPPNKGIRKVWWCGLLKKHNPADHKEHDFSHKGEWYHCYG